MEDKRYELNDDEWDMIKNKPPSEHPKERKRGQLAKYDNRRIMNGILWIARTGAPWRVLPARYGKWQTVYAHFRLWKKRGVFGSVFAILRADANMENISIDSTSCKVHQSTNGGEKRRIRRLGYPGAAGPQRFIPWWMAWAIHWHFCSVLVMSTIPSMPYLCLARSATQTETSSATKPTERKRSGNTSSRKEPHTRSCPEVISMTPGRWIGTRTRSCIW